MHYKNIFKIDTYFIIIGIVFLALGSITMALDPRMYHDVSILKQGDSPNSINVSFDDLRGRSIEQIKQEANATSVTVNSFPWVRALMAFNGFILLVIGIYYRKLENKIISLWNAIERTGEVRVEDLVVSLGFERSFILKSVIKINSQHSALYFYDSISDKIIDGRLKAEYPVTMTCENCGARSEEKISLSVLNSPKCKYCGSVLNSPEHFDELKKKILGQVKQQQITSAKGGFHVGIFILLLFLFWPGALYYLAKNNK